MHLVLGWWAAWIWAGVYIAVQLLEVAMAPLMLRKPPETPAAAGQAAIILFIPSAIVFGALAPALWLGGGKYGAALAVAMIASSMTNLIAISRGRPDLYGMVGEAFTARLQELSERRTQPVKNAKRPSPSRQEKVVESVDA